MQSGSRSSSGVADLESEREVIEARLFGAQVDWGRFDTRRARRQNTFTLARRSTE